MICRERYRVTDAQRDRHTGRSGRASASSTRRAGDHQESQTAPATGPPLPTLRRAADRPRALDVG
jgi:hypothetical protein